MKEFKGIKRLFWIVYKYMEKKILIKLLLGLCKFR